MSQTERIEIHSASTESLTSGTLKDLKELLKLTYEERLELEREITQAQYEDKTTQRRYTSWDCGFLMKRIFKSSFTRRKELATLSTDRLAELHEQLHLTIVSMEIDISPEQAEPFFRMRDEFSKLIECSCIWDTVVRVGVDNFHERTNASERIGRKLVSFSIDTCDLINWNQPVPHLRNSKGGDIYLYPGFVIYRVSENAFSVVDYVDVTLKPRRIGFAVEDTVPPDAKIIDHVWLKSNKDGSPDRRFAHNRQLPVAEYGGIELRSPTGLWEEFQFSRIEPAERFTAAWVVFVNSFLPQAVKSAEAGSQLRENSN